MEEEEEEGLVEVVDKLFVIIVAKLDIFHVTVRTQCIHIINYRHFDHVIEYLSVLIEKMKEKIMHTQFPHNKLF